MAARKTKPAAYSIDFAKLAGASELDERGLLRLDEARAIVAKATTFARDGDPPADRLWAALLSLDDGDELATAATRLTWSFPFLRGWNNEDAVIRYGAGALQWLEALLDAQKGKVGNIPAVPFYFVGTHLLAIGPEAASAVLRVARADDPDRYAFLRDWLARHKKPAWAALGELARAGDESAKAALEALAERSPGDVKKHLGKALAGSLGLGTKKLSAESILAVLDAAAAAAIGGSMPWPTMVARAGHFEYHAMRVTAVRAKTGDDWGILVEVVQGDVIGDEQDVRWPATVQHYTYGTKVPSGGEYLADAHPIPAKVAKERIDAARIAELDLRPGMATTGGLQCWPDVLRLRAAVASTPEIFFTPAAKVGALLGLKSAEVLVDVRELEHVSGTKHGVGDLARLPSTSPSWRSIAEAIVARSGVVFDPGTPNTDWRVHATKKVETGPL